MKKISLFTLLYTLLTCGLVFSQSPVNDNCSNAVPISVGASCVLSNHTSLNATSEPTSVAPNPTCVGYSGGDVWFTAVMPASGALRVETTAGGINPQVAVYSGTCGAFTQLFCMQLDNDRTYNNPALAGQTVYIRIYTYGTSAGGTFNICLWEPPVPVNDNCADALPLTVGAACSMSNFTNAYTTSQPTSVAPNPTCVGYSGGDIWFTAIMPASGVLRVETSNGTINPQVAVYSGTCGAFTQLFCMQLDNDRTFNNPALAGQTIYIRVYNYGNQEGGTFNICLWEPPVPVNDNCANATALPIGTNCVMSGFTNAYASAEPSSIAPNPSCGFYQGGDVWFTAVMPASGILRVETSNGTINPQVAVYSGTCGAFTQLFCMQLDNDRTYHNLALAGQTVYIRVYNYGSEEGGTFNICLWEPPVPVNDNCASAIALPIGTNCVMSGFTNAYASAEPTSVAPNPSCGFYQGGDVWFTLVMPATGVLTLQRTNISGVNAQFALYSGSCGSFTQIACAQLTTTMNVADTSLAGQTLYLRVYNYNSEEGGTFSICGFDPSCLASITTVNANQASCPTESDGSVEIIATCTNCQGGLEYSINNGSSWQPGNTFTGLAGNTIIQPRVRDSQNIVCTGSSNLFALGNSNNGVVYYQDNDNDGFGNTGVSQISCLGAPAGYIATGGDCNDSNNSVYPGASEICENGIDEDCNGFDLTCSGFNWIGALNTNWNETANWSGGTIPQPVNNAIISATALFMPFLNGNEAITDIEIESGASLFIQNGGSLTVSGELNNNGLVTVQNNGALVQTSGSTLAGSGSYSVERVLPSTTNFHYIGSPVSNVGRASFGIDPTPLNGGYGTQFTPLNTCDATQLDPASVWGRLIELRENATPLFGCSQSLWYTIGTPTLTNGRGYGAMASSGATLTFNGSINNGSLTYSGLGNSGGSIFDPLSGNINRGWHLVSNPYPSPISFGALNAELTAMGFDAQVQVYDAVNNVFIPSTSSSTLAVGQAFQIRNSGATQLDYTPTNSLRTANLPTFYDLPYEQFITVELENETSNMQTVIFFHEEATDGYDGQLEANRLFGAINVPLIYTRAEEEHMAFNAFAPLYNETKTVTLGVYDGAAPCAFTLRFNDLITLENTTVTLEDTKLNVFEPITEGFTYPFVTAANDNRDRFRLHFSMLDLSNIAGNIENAFTLFPNPVEDVVQIMITNTDQTYTLQVIDMSGKTLISQQIPEGTKEFQMNSQTLSAGMYLIKLSSAKGERTVQKLIKK